MKKIKNKKFEFVNITDNISEVLRNYPYTAEVFLAYGLHCVGCFANAFDTIEAGGVIHGMTEEEINEMLTEINFVINDYEKTKSKKST